MWNNVWKVIKGLIRKKRSFQFLLLIEVLLLLSGIYGLTKGDRLQADEQGMEIALSAGTGTEEGAYYIDAASSNYSVWLKAGEFLLTPGVYELKLFYEVQEDGVATCEIRDTEGSFYGVMSNGLPLYRGLSEDSLQFYVTETTDTAVITVDFTGAADLTIYGIELVHTNAGSRIFLFLLVLLSLLVDGLIVLYQYMGEHRIARDKLLTLFAIPAFAMVASIPLFTDYLSIGADAMFHWNRIEALAQSIGQGVFPVRIEGRWLFGHGYANSIFYGDTFLVLPALLRLIGFDMNVAYNAYVAAVNLATAWIAYYCFQKCFGNRYIGVFGSMLYTLAPYRIYNIYNRTAVGEYTAQTFLPLVVCGLYLIFSDKKDGEKKEWKWAWALPVIGFSGMIQSHTLTCEIVGMAVILLCVLLIKRVFRKHIFLQLVKVVVGTVLVNLWFLVPFLDLTAADVYRFSNNTGTTIQMRGIYPAHLIYTMQAAGSNSRFHELGMLDTEPFSVGIAMLFGIVVFWLIRYLRRQWTDENLTKAGGIAFAVGGIVAVMSLSLFPWDWIQSWNRVTGTLVPMIQFPTRLTIIPTVCMVFVSCIAGLWLIGAKQIWLRNSFFVIACGACIGFSLYQVSDTMLMTEGWLRLYSAEGMGHSNVLGAEYLPLDADMDFHYHDALPSEGVDIVDFSKQELDTTTNISVSAQEGIYYMELPMLYYKGYRAEDVATGEVFEVIPSQNYDVQVNLPAGYQGNVRTWYAGMWYWHGAEIISLISVVGIVAAYLFSSRKMSFHREGKRK